MPDVFDDDDRARAPHRVDALEQRALDVDLLDDRFDDPVGARPDVARSVSKPPVVISAAASGVKNGSGFSARARFSPVARDVGGQVEQQRRHAGVGEVRGDLRAHRAGAEDGDRSESRLAPLIARALR